MRRRLPWVITLPLVFAGSWVAHVLGRAFSSGSIESSEPTEHFELASSAHGGTATLGVAAGLAPFVAIALIVLVAWLWTRIKGRSWRGASAAWFLVIPPVAYVISEVLERLMGGGSEALNLHASQEPGLLLALAIQLPFGAVAYSIARLLLAAARAIVSKIRSLVPAEQRQRQADVTPTTWIAPMRWTCLVGARGLRGPPAVLSY